MRGTVMKITDSNVAVLFEDGTFRNLPHPIPLLALGGTIDATMQQRRSVVCCRKWEHRRLWIAAALPLLLFGLFFTVYGRLAPVRPVAVIAIDINPSLQMSVSQKGEVQSVAWNNEEARGLSQ